MLILLMCPVNNNRVPGSLILFLCMVFAHPASYILDQHGVSVFQRYSPPSRRERGGYAEKKFKIRHLPNAGLNGRWTASWCYRLLRRNLTAFPRAFLNSTTRR